MGHNLSGSAVCERGPALCLDQLPLLVGAVVGRPLDDLCAGRGGVALDIGDQPAGPAGQGVRVAGGSELPLLAGGAVVGVLVQSGAGGGYPTPDGPGPPAVPVDQPVEGPPPRGGGP